MYSKRVVTLCLGVMLNIEWIGGKEDTRTSAETKAVEIFWLTCLAIVQFVSDV
jgi:hypothetical protein